MQIKTLGDLEIFLKSRIPLRSAAFVAGYGLDRTKYFLKLIGNPQNKLKVIHIAGTSGKGSTATLISHVLKSQGFKTGLHLSPHITDIRERFQINNNFPDEKVVVKWFNKILPFIKQMESCSYGSPTYFEIIVALSFYMFLQEGVEYAVMETGLGGLYDATNCVSNKNKIVVLTKIGFDHMHILGKTISDIALQKASIIHFGNSVISIQQYPSAQKVIKKIAMDNNASVQWIELHKNFVLLSQAPTKIVFDANIQQSFKKIELSLGGIHQAENCTLALACLLLCSKRYRFSINENSLRQALKSVCIIGRMQLVKLNKKAVILDGAHNPQKMSSLIKSLIRAYPKQKFSFIVAFKNDKEYKKMLRKILPRANNIFVTNFHSDQENFPKSVDPQEILRFLESENFYNCSIINNSAQMINKVINKSKDEIVITGSFYLIASVYSYFNSGVIDK